MGQEARHPVTHRLRALERSLALERAELGLGHAVDRFLRRWHEALRGDGSLPTSFDFVATLVAAGFHLPTSLAALRYLDGCRQSGSLPDRAALLRILLPASRGRHTS